MAHLWWGGIFVCCRYLHACWDNISWMAAIFQNRNQCNLRGQLYSNLEPRVVFFVSNNISTSGVSSISFISFLCYLFALYMVLFLFPLFAPEMLGYLCTWLLIRLYFFFFIIGRIFFWIFFSFAYIFWFVFSVSPAFFFGLFIPLCLCVFLFPFVCSRSFFVCSSCFLSHTTQTSIIFHLNLGCFWMIKTFRKINQSKYYIPMLNEILSNASWWDCRVAY